MTSNRKGGATGPVNRISFSLLCSSPVPLIMPLIPGACSAHALDLEPVSLVLSVRMPSCKQQLHSTGKEFMKGNNEY